MDSSPQNGVLKDDTNSVDINIIMENSNIFSK